MDRGSVVLADLDPTRGHEQQGFRPCVVVSDADVATHQRFPMICLVPLTGAPGQGALYPPLSPGQSGLRKQSFALVDQLRSLDKRRIRRVFGTITDLELAAIDEGLRLFLGLS